MNQFPYFLHTDCHTFRDFHPFWICPAYTRGYKTITIFNGCEVRIVRHESNCLVSFGKSRDAVIPSDGIFKSH